MKNASIAYENDGGVLYILLFIITLFSSTHKDHNIVDQCSQ